VIAADVAGGEALLEKSAAILEARHNAGRGDWGRFLAAIGLHERAAQRHIAIAERAGTDARFREAVRTGWLSFSVAALTAQADDALLEQLLTQEAPPTRRQIEAQPDTGVGLGAAASVEAAITHLEAQQAARKDSAPIVGQRADPQEPRAPRCLDCGTADGVVPPPDGLGAHLCERCREKRGVPTTRGLSEAAIAAGWTLQMRAGQWYATCGEQFLGYFGPPHSEAAHARAVEAVETRLATFRMCEQCSEREAVGHENVGGVKTWTCPDCHRANVASGRIDDPRTSAELTNRAASEILAANSVNPAWLADEATDPLAPIRARLVSIVAAVSDALRRLASDLEAYAGDARIDDADYEDLARQLGTAQRALAELAEREVEVGT
jgi:ribosomal protein L37AE/L43A